jgi:formate dehydrogenase alpha subunit
VWGDGSSVTRISGVADAPVNAGHLCAKGRYAHAWTRSPDRLTHPLLRDGPGFREISWPEAIRWAARRLREIRDQHGPAALGVLTSSRSTNEAAYLLQKVFRAQIGTNNVDCCARVCHSSTALALSMATGTGAATASYADIERARIIVVAGANPTEAHPVVGARIKQAARRGARLLVIDPRVIELCGYASMHLQIEAGTNVALFNAIARVILDEDLADHGYVAGRTEGLAALRDHCHRASLGEASAACGVPVEQIREAARLIAGHGPVLFVTGLGLSELTQGTASVLALINLALLTGSIGLPGAGILPLRGQNNVQGNADMGSAPGLVTGYQPLNDPALRERLRDNWGTVPPPDTGLTIPEMFEAARRGRVRGLWIQGEDVLQSDPNEAAVRQALSSLDLLVVQELFLSETARFAHLVLPAAGYLEQDGTFTNAERRIQRLRRAIAPPGLARPDWEVAADLGRALGANWNYRDPADVMEEIARVAPDLFGGVRYNRLGNGGLQWPCPTVDHPGTATVHAGRFVRGAALFFAVPYEPTPERRTPELPFLLITGRVLQHYNVGTMTRRTPNRELAPLDCLAMNPADAAAAGLADGARALVESRYGRIVVPVRLGTDVRPGTLFLSFHYPETHANALTSSLVDPQSRCPEYKVTAVRVSPLMVHAVTRPGGEAEAAASGRDG